jgi:dolichol-phosphate mannosyltransferase
LSGGEVAGVAVERPVSVSMADTGLDNVGSNKAVTEPRSVTFVMPALNEEANLAHAVSELIPATGGLDDYEIVIVNDGSTDRTGEIAEGLARDNPRIRVVHNPHNMGFGGAYKVGVAHARMPYVIMVPGDSNHPPDGVTPILDLIGQADIVVPYVSNPEVRGRKRMVISEAYTRLLNFLFRLDLPYYNGLVLHRTALLRTITIETNGYAYQSEALVKLLRRGATTVTVAVPLAHSDPNTRAFKFKNVMRVGNTIWRLILRR